jgi:hypothetical protein
VPQTQVEHALGYFQTTANNPTQPLKQVQQTHFSHFTYVIITYYFLLHVSPLLTHHQGEPDDEVTLVL